ncbi:MAG: dethiobiotin synthase [Gammaproteobacteria bacterium]|nr:dethiobiotin synthase [Gammaproteobacteria bacterium]
MHSGYFITGTDTGCGKTLVTLGLMWRLQASGYSVLGMKPVASGCERRAEGLRNEDALRIQRQGSRRLPYEEINPFAFEPPIAPHLAAADAGVGIDIASIGAGYRRLAEQADRVLVEGVGGWHVPLSERQMLQQLVVALNLPVILVVGLRLGCINHALLTCDAIVAAGCQLAGWVANRTDPQMTAVEGNLQTLRDRIGAPLLGVVPYMLEPDIRRLAVALDPAPLERLPEGG